VIHSLSLLVTNHPQTGEQTRIPVIKANARASQTVCTLTSTIFAHCVPLPAPGPPSTNTTSGLTAAIIRLQTKARPDFCETIRIQWEPVVRRQGTRTQ